MKNNDEIACKCEEYKRECLCGDQDAADRLRSELSGLLDDPERFFDEVKTWLAQCVSLRDEAVALAQKGKTQSSMEYDALGRVSRPSMKKLLDDIRYYASWGDGGRTKLEDARNEFLTWYPENTKEMEDAVHQGELSKKYADKAYKVGSTGQPERELESLIDEAKRNGIKGVENKMRNNYKKGREAKERSSQARQYEKENASRTSEYFSSLKVSTEDTFTMQSTEMDLTGIHPNSLTRISPASNWTVLVDETGSDFTEKNFAPGLKSNEYGRIVALFVPEYTQLPDLPAKWHASDRGFKETRGVVETIRDSQCGLLGVSLRSLNTIHGEQWLSCIEALLDLAWRLMRIEGETRIELLVEQRGAVDPKMSELLQRTCDASLYHLSRAFPGKAENLRIDAKIIAKDGHPWNGYVDTAAFVWGGGSVKPLLDQSHWLKTCFIGAETHLLRKSLDLMEREEYLTAGQWSALVSSPDAETPNSLVSVLLENLGQRARTDARLWGGYMNDTCLHLNSKAIDLTRLKRQIDWLKAWTPDDAKFPLKLRLLWLTTKLAEANHHGKIVQYQNQRDEFNTLSERLFREDAPLVCNAALHLAVSYTNEFDFDGAKTVLARWQSLPPQVPGLQYYGQLLSSFGQHAAFVGDNDTANDYFRKAIETFEELSDSDSARLDIIQTSAYLLTALMDSGEPRRDELERELPKYFGSSVEDAAERLSVSDEPCDKYAHHILLRYIHCGMAPERVAKKYLANRSEWKIGTGHPWEMIDFYRALMFDGSQDRMPLLRNAYKLATAEDEGMTLRVIAAVILGSIWLDDPSVKDEYLKLVAEVTDNLPHLGDRGKVLREQIERRRAPLELARAVLPFNFR